MITQKNIPTLNEGISSLTAREFWTIHKEQIISSFREIQNRACQKLFLVGSVAYGDDDEESDIDLAVITGPGFDIKDANNTVQHMKKLAPSLIHIIFLQPGAEENILQNGGILICQ